MTSKKYWCLFCPETFDTPTELLSHMKKTIHRDKEGGIIFYHD